MNPNARQLAMRDVALMAALGIGFHGNDFGHEQAPQSYAHVPDFGHENFGSDFGLDALPGMTPGLIQAASPMPAPTPQAMQALWAAHATQAAHTQVRESILEPNKRSTLKVQRYAMGISSSITLGTTTPVTAQGTPQTKFRAQRVTTNAPETGFVILTAIQVANVNAIIFGVVDAFDWNANGQDQHLDLPTITPGTQLSFAGTYTGDLAGRTGPYTFIVTFKGPADLAA